MNTPDTFHKYDWVTFPFADEQLTGRFIEYRMAQDHLWCHILAKDLTHYSIPAELVQPATEHP